MTPVMKLEEYQTYDGIGLGQLLQRREVSAGELVQLVLGAIEKYNPGLNAVVQTLPQLANEAAARFQAELQAGTEQGPLAGVPLLLKDLLADIKGINTRNGSHLFDQYLPEQDAEIVRRYKAAGLIMTGKTATPELGLLPVTESAVYGITRNPWDPARTCGGSSGGAAAAVAARILPIAHGGDGGGSIRIPASNCGVFGLKPTRGSSPCGPHFAENWQGFVVQHVLTRSVRDSAAMLDIMRAGSDPGDAYPLPVPSSSYLQQLQNKLPRLRIGWCFQPFLGGEVSRASLNALQHTRQLLHDLGHQVEEVRPALASADELCEAMLVMVCGELAALVRNCPRLLGRSATWRDFEESTWTLACMGRIYKAEDFAWMRDLSLRQGRIMAEFHQQYDVLLTPVTNQVPALHGSLLPTPFEKRLSRVLLGRLGWESVLRMSNKVAEDSRRVMHYLGWTIPFNMSGQPAMSVPLYWTNQDDHPGPSLPVGSHFIAGHGQDALLLQLAQELEQAQPWAERRPPCLNG